MQDRGVDVMDMDRILDSAKAKVIGLSINSAALEATTSKPHREGVDVMISSR